MKAVIILSVVALLSTIVTQAQIKNAKTETVKVNGDCSMCKITIEKVGSKKKQYKTDWDADTKLAIITYDNKKAGLDAILKNIALSGYDNVKYLAPDEAYYKLPNCCQYKREKKEIVKPITESTASMQNHNNHTQGNNVMDMQKASQLNAVIDSYFALKDALVNTDGVTASAKAAAMLVALGAVEMGKLKMEEHTVWMKIEKGLNTDVQHIKENKDIEHQREHFMSLSKNMYELIKAAKTTETAYYQFCPMANDGKGANWLSKENAIKNPYYGSQMLTCGKTVEIIKQ
jgi:Protein of unknown function (DUF3347)